MHNKHHLICGIVILLLLSSVKVEGAIFISDHFDSQATGTLGNDPPPPWGTYGFFSHAMEISPTAAHNSGGKGFRINWPTGQIENGLCAPNGSVGSWGNEIYVGYWHRHKTPWVNNSSAAHKWLHFFVGGQSAMWNYDHGQGLVLFFNGATHFTANMPWSDNDGSWHSWVFRMKLGTGSSGVVQIWRDGTELTITPHPQAPIGPSTGFSWGGSSFEQRMCFGFQHHAGLGAGMWEDWDDIIVASTKQEVLDFLGGSPPPPPPSVALTSLSITGPSSVDENDTAFYTATAQFSDASTQAVTAASSWSEDSSYSTVSLGTFTTSAVPSDQLVTITASYTFNGVTKTATHPMTIKDLNGNPGGSVTLLQEPFSDNALDQRGWYDVGSTNSAILFDAGRQSNVLEATFPSGATTPTGGALRHLFAETESAYTRFFVKYGSNWQWTGQNFGPHEWYLLTNANHAWKGPARSRLTFYIEGNNGSPLIGIQDAENIDATNIGVNLTGSTENRAVAGCNGSTDGYPDDCYQSGGLWYNGKQWKMPATTFLNDRWYKVEVYVQMNSIVGGIAQKDGVLQYWLDGNLLLSLNDVVFRTGAQPTLKFNQVMFAPYFGPGTPAQQSFRVDDLVVMQSPPGSSGGDTTPPAAPANLQVN